MACAVIGILPLAIIAWLIISGLKIRDLSNAPAIACGRCGHFLASGQLRCPECGTDWTVGTVERLTRARSRAWRLRLVIAAVLLLAVIGGIVAILVNSQDQSDAAGEPPTQPATRPATQPTTTSEPTPADLL